MIPQRIRVALALTITFGCGATQVSTAISGETYQPKTSMAQTQPEELWVPDALPTTTHPPVSEQVQTTTTTIPVPQPETLGQLVTRYFYPTDHAWALQVAFCESSAQPNDTNSTAHHHSSGASGWFQHLPKYWEERTTKADIQGADIMDPESNVRVAAWLLYDGGGKSHWNESKGCWS